MSFIKIFNTSLLDFFKNFAFAMFYTLYMNIVSCFTKFVDKKNHLPQICFSSCVAGLSNLLYIYILIAYWDYLRLHRRYLDMKI